MGFLNRFTRPPLIISVIIVILIAFLFYKFNIVKRIAALISKRPNVILIYIDALRPDHLGCYGYSKNTSPNIDEFAEDAILFEYAFCHIPHTPPSTASTFSGFFPHETKIYGFAEPLLPEIDSIAEMMKRKGYSTAAVICNYALRSGRGFEQGFDIYDEEMQERELVRRNYPERIAEKGITRVIEIIRKFRGKRFFLYLHAQDPHGPYTPPEPYNRLFFDKSKKPLILNFNETDTGYNSIPRYQRLGDIQDFHYYVSQYDGEIRYFDFHFKRLIDALKTMGLYDNTLIVISADHGEGMGEFGSFFAHGENLSNSQIRVPLILRYGEGGARRKEYVQHIDLVPTILKAAGIESNNKYRGRDLLADEIKESDIFSEREGEYTLLSEGMKLVYIRKSGEFFLYDMQSDFDEKRNLADDINYRKILKRMKRKAAEIFNDDRLNLGMRKVRPLSDEEVRKLRSLGYIH